MCAHFPSLLDPFHANNTGKEKTIRRCMSNCTKHERPGGIVGRNVHRHRPERSCGTVEARHEWRGRTLRSFFFSSRFCSCLHAGARPGAPARTYFLPLCADHPIPASFERSACRAGGCICRSCCSLLAEIILAPRITQAWISLLQRRGRHI